MISTICLCGKRRNQASCHLEQVQGLGCLAKNKHVIFEHDSCARFRFFDCIHACTGERRMKPRGFPLRGFPLMVYKRTVVTVCEYLVCCGATVLAVSVRRSVAECSLTFNELQRGTLGERRYNLTTPRLQSRRI